MLGEHVFPIYSLRENGKDLIPIDIHGACFAIGINYFITALHVLNYAKGTAATKIGFFSQVSNGCVNMCDYEIIEEFPESDIAIIKSDEMYAHDKKPKHFKWSGRELLIFDEIRAMGYPHGYDGFKGVSIGRGFSGTVLCNNKYERGELNLNCYELSFQSPKGLSGGCLLDKNYKVYGVMFGNSEKAMHVFEDETIIEVEGVETKRIETKNETTFIGMAVSNLHIFKLQSEKLGKTIHDHLKEYDLH